MVRLLVIVATFLGSSIISGAITLIILQNQKDNRNREYANRKNCS